LAKGYWRAASENGADSRTGAPNLSKSMTFAKWRTNQGAHVAPTREELQWEHST
jgi:hypothetical protein